MLVSSDVVDTFSSSVNRIDTSRLICASFIAPAKLGHENICHRNYLILSLVEPCRVYPIPKTSQVVNDHSCNRLGHRYSEWHVSCTSRRERRK